MYQYDALGKKLKETIGSNFTDYNGNTIYKNGALYQISHDEGRIIDGEYEYNIKDHLGNLRVAFRDSLGFAKIIQANSYGIWGEDLPTLSFLKPLWKQDAFRFTGKESLPETGYTDFGARFYDNIVPRFISIDPHAEKYELISPYSYGFNNPTRFRDIDGKDPGDVVVLFSGANLNPFDKNPYGITTQIKQRLTGKLNGGKVENFISDYGSVYDTYESGESGFPIGIDQNLDELTQEAYNYIKNNKSKTGKVAVYGYSWGGVLASHLSRRLSKENIDITSLIIIDAANGSSSDEVNRNLPSNVKSFTNVYQENEKMPVLSRGYPATKSSSKTNGKNIRVSYVRNDEGNFEKASHTNVDDATLQSVVDEFLKILNKKSNEQKK